LYFISAQLCEDVATESLPLPLILSFDDLEEDSSMEKCFYLRAHRVGNRNIIIKVGQLYLTHDWYRWWPLGITVKLKFCTLGFYILPDLHAFHLVPAKFQEEQY
jgi:hypothetical protein